MQNNQDYSEIFEKIVTKADCDLLKEEVESLAENVYRLKNKEEVRQGTVDLVSKFSLKAVQEQLANVQFVTVTLASEGSVKLMQKISQWIKKTVSANTVLDITINPDLIGGATIAYKGKYFDGSVKKEFTKAFEKYV